jgi:hypothetical protein
MGTQGCTRLDQPSRPPIVPAEVSGDAYAMGEQQGRLCRVQVHELDSAIVELLGVAVDGGPARLARLVGRCAVPVVGAIARRFMGHDLEAHYPRQHDRMAGIAAGAGVPLSWLFVAPSVEIALNGAHYVRPGACTALGVTGSRARNGEPMIVKNFDYPDAARDTYLVRRSRPTGRGLAASIEVGAAPLVGSHEGVNERGLAVAYNYGTFAGSAGARVAITNLVQELLEECASVPDALARLAQRPRAGSAILMLADSSGELVSAELSPDDIAVRRAADHGDRLAHANHALTEAMAARDVPHDAVLSRWNPRPVRGARVHASSEHRQRRAEELLDACGAASEADLERFAADHDGGEACTDNTICRHGPYYRTTCSVVLFPRRRTMKVMFANPCAGRFDVVSL